MAASGGATPSLAQEGTLCQALPHAHRSLGTLVLLMPFRATGQIRGGRRAAIARVNSYVIASHIHRIHRRAQLAGSPANCGERHSSTETPEINVRELAGALVEGRRPRARFGTSPRLMRLTAGG